MSVGIACQARIKDRRAFVASLDGMTYCDNNAKGRRTTPEGEELHLCGTHLKAHDRKYPPDPIEATRLVIVHARD